MSTSVYDLAAVTLAALLGAGVIIALLHSRAWLRTPVPTGLPHAGSGPVFLFDGETLIDANKDALALIKQPHGQATDFDAMIIALTAQFPKLADSFSQLDQGRTRVYGATDPELWLDMDRRDETTRIAVVSDDHAGGEALTATLAKHRDSAELRMMRHAADFSDQLIWQLTAAGDVLWSNRAYRKLKERDGKAAAKLTARALKAQNSKDALPLRQALHKEGDDNHKWFDLNLTQYEDTLLCTAMETTALIRADENRRSYVQTLGKTFADLSIGLAIFDATRRLIMYNPAFVEITSLPIDLLTARPQIDTVLDHLRGQQLMPEPANYGSWREKFTALEDGARNGTYCENWSLPDGQTFRVSGRPHPDGAFALLFEDISAEVSLNRRFRKDIETGQAVLDTLSDAIAVFSHAGTFVMSNHAYARLWSMDPDILLTHRDIQTELTVWQDGCVPSPMWSRLLDRFHETGKRKPWSDDAMLLDGRHLRCHANPLRGGMTMVRFAIARPLQPTVRELAQQTQVAKAHKG